MALDPALGVPYRFAVTNDQPSTHTAERPPLKYEQKPPGSAGATICPPQQTFRGEFAGPRQGTGVLGTSLELSRGNQQCQSTSILAAEHAETREEKQIRVKVPANAGLTRVLRCRQA
jgi:hypothetical protein